MSKSTISSVFPDVNVWLALTSPDHEHFQSAWNWYRALPEGTVLFFCRVTQLAFLRHLTNKTIMGDQVLTPGAAWKKCGEFLALPEVRFLAEPPGLDEQLGQLTHGGRTSPNLWTDAYLASFARCAGLRLVTFDHGFARFTGLELLILKPE